MFCCASVSVGLFSSNANELRKAHRHLSTEPVRELPKANGGRKRTTQPRLSDEKVSQIVTAYETGKTVFELAAEYGCHRVTFSAVLKRRGVILRRTSPTAAQIDEMIRLYESGLSLAKVAERFDVHASTVLAQLRKRRVPTRPPVRILGSRPFLLNDLHWLTRFPPAPAAREAARLLARYR